MFIVPLGINSGVIEKINIDVFVIGCTIAIMSTALPLILDSFALKYVPKSIFGVLMSASPAVSALAGMVILDEVLTLYQWVGILLISLACMGATMSFKSNVVATN
ncbi:Threonine/homoserine exporter RhtA [compost metagenome]